jgi:hypothetical protein
MNIKHLQENGNSYPIKDIKQKKKKLLDNQYIVLISFSHINRTLDQYNNEHV